MSTILITGAAGFLGTELVRVFRAEDHTVRATDLPRADFSALEALGAECVPADLTDPANVGELARGIDIVIHAAGIFDLSVPEEVLYKINRDVVGIVCDAANEAGVKRIVLISSTSVYGPGQIEDEDAPKNPHNAYARSKWAGEQLGIERCEQHGIEWAVLRPTLIYGPGSRYAQGNSMAIFALMEWRGVRNMRIASGGPLGHHVHVHDVARAAHLAATKPEANRGLFNVADDHPMPLGDMIRLMGDETGVNINSPALPWFFTWVFSLFRPVARWVIARENSKMAHLWTKLCAEQGLVEAFRPRIDEDWIGWMFVDNTFSTTRLKALGFEPVYPDPTVGLRQAAAWYRKQGWLPQRSA